MAPGELAAILEKLPKPQDKNVLVGQGDDAGVYLLRDDLALVLTVDFFTPVVDDPFAFGMIAAANSLSDIYAMGAKPLVGLNIVAFPEKGPPDLGVLAKILEGGYKKAAEAGLSIIGGHTVDDKEPKYGIAVTGIAHPNDLFCNKNAKPGDLLILTKPIGTGVLATALKADMAPEGTEQVLIDTCSLLNDKAAEIARRFDAHAVTDITGFGLVLHSANLISESGLGCELWFDRLPVLPGVNECMEMGLIPAGTYANRTYAYQRGMKEDADLLDEQVLLLNDAQTSGGLLVALDPKMADEALQTMLEKDLRAAMIGRITENVGEIRLMRKP